MNARPAHGRLPLRLDNRRVVAFLGEEPHTPAIDAVPPARGDWAASGKSRPRAGRCKLAGTAGLQQPWVPTTPKRDITLMTVHR